MDFKFSFDQVESFLLSREVSTDVISTLKCEKMDPVAINTADVATLTSFGLTKGDALTLKAFAVSVGNEDTAINNSSKLLSSMIKQSSSERARPQGKKAIGCVTVKATWHHWEKKRYVQVRRSTGGGVATLILNNMTNFEDLKNRLTETFFPNGVSQKAKLSNCKFLISDSTPEHPITEDFILGDYVKVNQRHKNRFILYTKLKSVIDMQDIQDEDDNDLLFNAPNFLHFMDDLQRGDTGATTSFNETVGMGGFDLTSSLPRICTDCGSTTNSTSCLRCEQNNAYAASLFIDSAAAELGDQQTNLELDEENNVERPQRTRRAPLRYRHSLNSPAPTSIPVAQDLGSITNSPTPIPTSSPVSQPPPLDLMELRSRRLSALVGVSSTPMRVAPESRSQVSISISDDELTIPPDNGLIETNVDVVKIHRLNIREDMIVAFKSIALGDRIEFEVVNIRGEKEKGVGLGVARDIYTATWREIFDGLFVGDRERVPLVRHDFYVEEWDSISRILVKGYQDTGYFPIQLSQAFITHCLYDSVSNDQLIDSFLKYLTLMESKVVDEALRGAPAEFYEDEDFLDILDRFKCKTRVTTMSVHGVVLELARQELIQRPYLMACSWKKALSVLKNQKEFSSELDIKQFYRTLQPTNKKVIKLLECNPKNDLERDCFSFLKQYIRGVDDGTLRKFLRFCSGSDAILVDKIEICFLPGTTSTTRHPVAHTCGPMVELPSSYNNFCEFREEMTYVLQNQDWSIDII